MKKYPFFFILAFIILVVSICTPKALHESLPKVSYTVAKKQNAKKTVNVSGKINSEEQNTQISNKTYYISECLVKQNQRVKKGQNIFKIDIEKTKLLYTQTQNIYPEDEYITSEHDGIVSNILVENNSICKQSAPLLTIIDTKKLCATLFIGEDVFSQIKEGQKLIISGNAFDKKYKGEIFQINTVASQTTSSATYIEATAEIQDIDEHLKPGFNIKAKITTKTIKDAIILPSSVISQDNKGEFVYKLVKNKAKKVYIKTDEITSKGTIIKNGINAGDYIISEPNEIKKDDSFVSFEEK